MCPPSHSFCATRERALRAQAQELSAEEGCDVSKFTSERMARETSLYLLTTCAFLGCSPAPVKLRKGHSITHGEYAVEIQVRAAPRRNNLEMEMDEPD